MKDPQTSSLSEAEKALFAFVDKVNPHSVTITPEDIQPLYAHGGKDDAIYDAITVCALFNFYNRWIDSTGVHALTEEQHKAGAARMAAGYIRTP
jgi:alkylhydroperoxidase family enzyme